MSTTVFVAGAGGYIGKHIVSQLLSKGYTVIGSVRNDEKENVLYPCLKMIILPT